MNERIKELAKQAGLQPYYDKEFIHFAELVRQDEREKCAKLCEAYIAPSIGKEIAAAIRGRTE